MLVKDVYKRIEDLERDRRNFMNIQEFCLGHMSEDPNNGVHTKIYGALEDGANLNESLRNLASGTIRNIDNEIARLKRIIENAQVKID
jgi:uncharacterized protein (DUF2126 family)